MVTFLAQYGTEWLRDSHVALKALKEKKWENGLLISQFMGHAKLLTCASEDDRRKRNKSHTWSKILLSQESRKFYMDQGSAEGVHMPFGLRFRRARESGRGRSELFELSLKRYESKVKRLIDTLPPGIFENDEPEYIDTIQGICSMDLENFLLFLQSEPMEPVCTVKSRKLTPPVIDIGSKCVTPIANEREKIMEQKLASSKAVTSRLGLGANENIRGIGVDMHELLYTEKLGLPVDATFFLSLRDRILPTSDWSRIGMTELTLHLENLSAIYYSEYAHRHFLRSIGNWKLYLKQFRLDPSLSTFLAPEHRPRCLSQSYYWRLFKLPENSPPTLGCTEPEDLGSDRRGIRFTGFIIEMVRNCLAKWTATADVSCRNESRWTAKIPQKWSLVFQPRSDYSMLCQAFRRPWGFSKAPYISIQKQMGNRNEERDMFTWTCYERIIWECQKYLLD
ncbi:hypothetical protein FGB62_144g05 [Gracilaria domingensis]|nr:hypothetical protein FGB62_144g05 [Gracilaria domingensis]